MPDLNDLTNRESLPRPAVPENLETGIRQAEPAGEYDLAEAVSSGLVLGTINLGGQEYRVGVKGLGGELPEAAAGQTVDRLSEAEKAELVSKFKLPLGLTRLEAWKLPVGETAVESGDLKEPPRHAPFAGAQESPAYIPRQAETVAVDNLAAIATREPGAPLERLRQLVEAKRTISGGSKDSVDAIASQAAAMHERGRQEAGG